MSVSAASPFWPKTPSVYYKGVKINIVDTPGHADFGGEVERVLKMVDGVLLLVDAVRRPHAADPLCAAKGAGAGPSRSLSSSTRSTGPTPVIDEVVDEVLELLLDLDATDEQLDSPVVFCSGRAGHRLAVALMSRAAT